MKLQLCETISPRFVRTARFDFARFSEDLLEALVTDRIGSFIISLREDLEDLMLDIRKPSGVRLLRHDLVRSPARSLYG